MRVVAIVVLIAAAAAELPAWAQPPGPVDIRGHWAEDRIQFLFRRNIVDLASSSNGWSSRRDCRCARDAT